MRKPSTRHFVDVQCLFCREQVLRSGGFRHSAHGLASAGPPIKILGWAGAPSGCGPIGQVAPSAACRAWEPLRQAMGQRSLLLPGVAAESSACPSRHCRSLSWARRSLRSTCRCRPGFCNCSFISRRHTYLFVTHDLGVVRLAAEMVSAQRLIQSVRGSHLSVAPLQIAPLQESP
jgi:hypothetical protein